MFMNELAAPEHALVGDFEDVWLGEIAENGEGEVAELLQTHGFGSGGEELRRVWPEAGAGG